MLIGSNQRLLVYLGLQDVVEVFRDLKHVGQCLVGIDEFDGAAHDQSQV